MVKRQKEKQYQSSIEHKLNSQIRSGRRSGSNNPRPLPFDCCALSLTPFTNPVCCVLPKDGGDGDDDTNMNNSAGAGAGDGAGGKKLNLGIIFETSEIMPYLFKHHKNPITGLNMSSNELIKLNMERNDIDNTTNSNSNSTNNSTHNRIEDKLTWQCPILNKPFMNHTKIVAIKIPPGNIANVYSYEAVHMLNIKPKNYVDLISGSKFHPKKDMILLNDDYNKITSISLSSSSSSSSIGMIHDQNHELSRSLFKWRDVNNFIHLKTLRDGNNNNSSSGGGNDNITLSISAKRIMDKLHTNQKQKQKEKEEEEAKEKRRREKKRKQLELEQEQEQNDNTIGNTNTNKKRDYKQMKILTSDLGITYTKGKISGSFTSTSLPSYSSTISSSAATATATTNDIREATQEEILSSLFTTMKKRKKQKGFVRMYINLNGQGGAGHHMDFELHCDIVPRTCYNFIKLVEDGWYDGTYFHRSIRNFMIQGGGSDHRGNGTGTGTSTSTSTSTTKHKKKKPKSENFVGKEKGEDQSVWGEPFEDEFDQRLKHAGPGILSMANAGPNTNKCQFFITYATAPHLNNKHTVFGKVLKGLDVLHQIENIPTNTDTDVPLEDIYIEKMIIFGDNPVSDAERMEEKKILKRIEERKRDEVRRKDQSALGHLKAKKVVENKDKNGNSDGNNDNDSSNSSSAPSVPKVGRYLKQKTKKKKKEHLKSSNKNDDDDDGNDSSGNFVMPSRLPAAPKKTTFGDFSGW